MNFRKRGRGVTMNRRPCICPPLKPAIQFHYLRILSSIELGQINSACPCNLGLGLDGGEPRNTVPQLSQGGRAVPAEFFSGIGIIPWAGSGLQFSYLSYGGLFEVLVRLGLELEGRPEAFTVTGADSAFYEFSYRFADTDSDGSYWHYIRDGEPIRCVGGIPAIRISSDEFQTITGLKFHKPGT